MNGDNININWTLQIILFLFIFVGGLILGNLITGLTVNRIEQLFEKAEMYFNVKVSILKLILNIVQLEKYFILRNEIRGLFGTKSFLLTCSLNNFRGWNKSTYSRVSLSTGLHLISSTRSFPLFYHCKEFNYLTGFEANSTTPKEVFNSWKIIWLVYSRQAKRAAIGTGGWSVFTPTVTKTWSRTGNNVYIITMLVYDS